MPVRLPSSPPPASAKVRLVSSMNELRPAFGGPVQRMARMGSRFAVDYVLPPMEYEQAMLWIGLLASAEVDTVIMPFPQGRYDTGSPGSPTVDGAGQAGTSLNVRGLTPGTAIGLGQAFTVISGGARYNYIVVEAAEADGDGKATLRFSPMLRYPPSNNDQVLLAEPEIEGFAFSGGLEWSIDTACHVGLEFTVEEKA